MHKETIKRKRYLHESTAPVVTDTAYRDSNASIASMFTTATVPNSVEGTAITIIDATAVVLRLFTVGSQTTTSVLLHQQLLSRVVRSVQPLTLPCFAPLYNRLFYRADC